MEEKKEVVEIKEEKKKKIKPWMIFCIIMGLIVLAFVGYVACDNYIKEHEEDEYEEETTPSEDATKQQKNVFKNDTGLDDDSIKDLFTIFRTDNHIEFNGYTSNKAKLRLAYENIPESSYSTIACSKVGGYLNTGAYGAYCNGGADGEDYQDALAQGDKEKQKELIEQRATTKSISSTIMKAKVEELFGSDYPYQPEDFGIGLTIEPECQLMHYDQTNDVYAFYSQACGGTTDRYSERLLSAEINGDHLYLKSKVLKTEIESDTIDTIKTYEFKKDAKNGNYVFVQVTTEVNKGFVNNSTVDNDTIIKLFSIFSIAENYISAGADYKDNAAKIVLAVNQLKDTDFVNISCSKVGVFLYEDTGYPYCGEYSNDDLLKKEELREVLKTKETKAIAASVIGLKVQELFGSDYYYTKEDFSGTIGYKPTLNCQTWHYVKDYDLYAYYGGTCGGSGPYYKEEIRNAYEENSHLFIETEMTDTDAHEYAEFPIGTKILYEFKKDARKGNYVFVQVTKE